MSQSVVSSTIITGQIVDRQGKLTPAAIYWFQQIGRTINASFDNASNFQGFIGGNASLTLRGVPLAQILANIDNTGVVTSNGIDFARIYQNQNINFIADGTGSPIAGGKAAFAALIASAPTANDFLMYNGTDWVPALLPVATDSALGIVQPDGTTITIAAGVISATPSGPGYLKGTVSVVASGTSGTFTGTGTVTGATTAMAAVASDSGSLIALCGTTQVGWVADVTSADTVEVQVTLPNIGPTWGTIAFNVVVFP